MHHIDHCHCLRTRSIHQFRQLARSAIASAFSGSARELTINVMRKTNTRANTRSNETITKKRALILLHFQHLWLLRRSAPVIRNEQSASFLFCKCTSIARSALKLNRHVTIVFYRPYNLSDRKESPHHIDFNCRPYQPSILPRYWFITSK